MVSLSKYEIERMQIKRIEKEIRDTPYHKGTEHHIGRLRARLSRLREQLTETSVKKGGGGGYAVKKQGDATIILIGPPSSGKSTLINKLTNAQSKVAPYAFTTVNVIPGMMVYKNARIQILDVPGLIEGAEEGKGRGREVLSVARGADLIVLMTDVDRPEALKRIEKALTRNGIRLNISKPHVILDKKTSGGVIIHSNISQELSKETIKSVINEIGIKNAEITISEKLTLERLIDSLSNNRIYVPALYVKNKLDLRVENGNYSKTGGAKLNHLPGGIGLHLAISARNLVGIDKLKETIWDVLGLVCIYLVRPSQEPNFENPVVMKKDQTLSDVAEKIGSDFSEGITRAKIWGVGAKFPGQEVSLSTKVQEGMQIRFI